MPRVARDLSRDPDCGAPDGVVEPGREHRDVGTRPALGDELGHERAGIEDEAAVAVHDGHEVGQVRQVEPVARCRPPRRPLQLDGGLGLVAHRRAPAEEHRDRVEQAAHAGGGQGRRPAGEVAHVGDAGGVDAAHRHRNAGGELTPDRRHAPRLADRRRAPGHGYRPQMADALEAVEPGDQHLAAPERAVGAVAEAVERERDDRVDAARARPCTRRRVRGGAAPRRWGRRGRAPTSSTGTPGGGRARRPPVTTPYSAGRWSTAWRNDWYVARCSRSPRWWLATTSCSRVTAIGALQLAPDREHRARGRAGEPAAVRARSRATAGAPARGRRAARTTESSQRMWMGRSWVRRPSTSGPRRATASASSCAIGSSLPFPLVITSGAPTPRTRR